MSLNQKTMTLLANTLAEKVATEIMLSDAFVEFLMEQIPDRVDAELGECDDDLLFDLSAMVMERMSLCTVKFQG